jgi:2-(1,2-epoxy-1,2-dihydrophenyl)acetyl-CoA isomerase
LNALSAGLRADLFAVSREITSDDSVRAVILTGAGRGFCAGADLSGGSAGDDEPAPPSQNDRVDQMGWTGTLATAIYKIGVPTIAAMNGVAAGAGMSMSLACDIRVGSAESRFKTVFAERNLSPDTGMSYFLPRLIGYGRAADLIFTSRDVFGEEAYRLGLLDRFVAAGEVLDTAREIAVQAAALPPIAIRSGKRVLQQNQDLDFQRALQNETMGLSYGRLAPNDVVEQAAAFREKRKGRFTGS